MGEEVDIEVEIPSHFLCPISLLLMRDPVTVSTGITYDRPSIEHWLLSSNQKPKKKNPSSGAGAVCVCPVTKQSLSSSTADLTPNHTLRRLIQSWCTLHSLDRIPTPKLPLSHSTICKLISDASLSPSHLSSSLHRFKSIALHGPSHDRSSLPSSGAVPFLISHLHNTSTSTNDASETLAAISAIDASREELNIDKIGDEFLTRLILFLSDGDSHSRLCSIKLLKSIYAAADPIHLTAVKPELFSEIVRLLRDRDRVPLQASKWGLKLLFELNPWGRNRVKAVNAGAVEALIEILLDGADQKRLCELVVGVLDQLCGCAEGRAGLLGHGAGLAVVSKRILRVSNTVSDRAVRILGSVSKNSANGGVLAEMLQVGAVAKLCLVVQVESSLKTKERAKEILRAHSRVWRTSICVPTHLLPSYPS